MRALVKLVLAGLLCAALLPREAAARRGIAIVNYGDHVSHVGEIAPENQAMVAAMTGTPVDVGYFHQRVGLFWISIWTWDGAFCLYDSGNSVWELSHEEAASLLGKDPGSLRAPWVYRFPPGLFLLLGIGGFVWFAGSQSDPEQDAQRARLEGLLGDARYKQALEHFGARLSELDGEEDAGETAFEESVQLLVEQGIRPDEARADLSTLIQFVVAASQNAS